MVVMQKSLLIFAALNKKIIVMQVLNKKDYHEHVDVRLSSNDVYVLHSSIQSMLKKQVENSDGTNIFVSFDLLSKLHEIMMNMDTPF